MWRTDDRGLRQARKRFAELLVRPKSREVDWQQLFAECPHILSRGLPLRLEASDIIVGGRPGISEADFYLYPRGAGVVPSYGAVELKRPNSKILRSPRKGILDFSATASCAIRQARKAVQNLRGQHVVNPLRSIIFGNDDHIFVIMGLSHELVQKVHLALMDKDFRELISERACHIVPYNSLLRTYEKSLPLNLEYLALQERRSHQEIHHELSKIRDLDERLFEAASNGWDDSALYLLRDPNKPNPNRKFGGDESNALLWASFYGDYLLVLQLLNDGAELHSRDNRGRTAVSVAAMRNNVDVLELLLNRGADVRGLDYPGWTMMFLYQRRALYSEIRSLSELFGYPDEREILTFEAWVMSKAREEFLTENMRCGELIPLLREKFIWLRELPGRWESGTTKVAPEGMPKVTADELDWLLGAPHTMLTAITQRCIQAGLYQDGIDALLDIRARLGKDAINPDDDIDITILAFELAYLYFLLDDARAELEWVVALAGARRFGWSEIAHKIDEYLAAMRGDNQEQRSALKDRIRKREAPLTFRSLRSGKKG